MTENFENKVVNGVATERKKYVKPEIEVIDLDAQPQLLVGSYTGNAGFQGIEEDDI